MRLDDYSIVEFDGPDAVALTHAQFANDVASLPVGHWQWNAWLTAKGRVIAVFALLKRAPDALLALVPDMPADAFAEPLKRFVFRRKLRIASRADLAVVGIGHPPQHAAGAASAPAAEHGIELDFGSAECARTLLIATREAAADLPADDGGWRRLDLRFGLPRLDASQREQWTPQQLALDRLQAYSVSKGCYPGQEIVARTHFLGKAKRAATLLELRGPVNPGDDVTHAGTAIGTVAGIATGTPTLALAVLPLDAPTDALAVSGSTARAVPMLDGLAR